MVPWEVATAVLQGTKDVMVEVMVVLPILVTVVGDVTGPYEVVPVEMLPPCPPFPPLPPVGEEGMWVEPVLVGFGGCGAPVPDGEGLWNVELVLVGFGGFDEPVPCGAELLP